jgi:hypothetical protein
VRAITVRLDNQRYLMRTELQGHASEAFRAIGVRPPPLAHIGARISHSMLLGEVVVQ